VKDLRSQLEREGTVRIGVKVVPKSSRTGLAEKMPGGVYKIRVAAPPEKGKANAALCEFLAKELGVPKRNVAIESGHAASLKRVRITASGRRA